MVMYPLAALLLSDRQAYAVPVPWIRLLWVALLGNDGLEGEFVLDGLTIFGKEGGAS
jgi:hypothetical protein